MVIAQIDFPFAGPWGREMAAALGGLAADIAAEPGLRWKIWTEAPEAGRAGGLYAFETAEAARDYVRRHTARLAQFGIGEVRALVMDTNPGLGAVTRAPG